MTATEELLKMPLRNSTYTYLTFTLSFLTLWQHPGAHVAVVFLFMLLSELHLFVAAAACCFCEVAGALSHLVGHTVARWILMPEMSGLILSHDKIVLPSFSKLSESHGVCSMI